METNYASIVIPVFNGEETLNELTARIDSVFKTLNRSYDIIFVDDGSSDNSWPLILSLREKYRGKITAVRFTKNFGQHNAILCGLHHITGKVVITMDDDLQHPPEEIPVLLSAYEKDNADVVYGMPRGIKHSPLRELAHAIVRNSRSDKKMRDGSSFRLLDQRLAKEIRDTYHHNLLFLDPVISWYTGNIVRVNVAYHPRRHGRSGYSLLQLVLQYYRIMINYTAAPLKLITYGGLTASLVAFIVGFYFFYRKLVYNVPLGYTSLIVSIMFSTGLILFCIGIIGKYLHKVYEFQHKRAMYFVQQVLDKNHDH